MSHTDAATLWSLQYRVSVTVLSDIAPEIAALGLDAKELFVLAEIDEHQYPADLADRLCMPRPTVTTNLKRLEGAGLVRREIDPQDLRRHRLHLTDAGREALSRGMAILVEAFGARLSRLSAAEQAQLQGMLERLVV